ncbi:MAG: hypothetical protein K8R68_06135 [Bacteroidales bacterium]|nr:hypothetical protein [Bacteroidales bacterium]
MKTIKEYAWLIAFAVSVLTIIHIGFTISQGVKLKKLQYSLDVINYNPAIKIEGCYILGYKSKPIGDTLINDERVIQTNYILDLRFLFKNIGNVKSRISHIMWSDTTSGSDRLREIFYSNLDNNRSNDTLNNFRYYDHIEIQPNEIKEFDSSFPISFIDNQTFTLHILLVYKNDLNMYYDTYYWARFKVDDIGVAIDTISVPPKIFFDKDPMSIFSKIDDNNSYTIPKNKKETNKVIKLLKGISEKNRSK